MALAFSMPLSINLAGYPLSLKKSYLCFSFFYLFSTGLSKIVHILPAWVYDKMTYTLFVPGISLESMHNALEANVHFISIFPLQQFVTGILSENY
jgi:hypothetical protein